VPHIEIRLEGIDRLAAYASVPIAFVVDQVLDREALSEMQHGSPLRARRLAAPWVKDYDAGADGGPAEWGQRFDVARWCILAAFVDGERAGGAAVIAREGDIELLGGRDDLALLWDLRVGPSFRRALVGSALMAQVEQWARNQGARALRVETQNINVPACRFYQRCGFRLTEIVEGAYDGLPDEMQLVWEKPLAPDQPPSAIE
jgi:GNAT superfamily N-acetyltransferase